ncbi:MAG: hypothetical protein V4695_08305 [Pseudomonadota bacterium]
MRAALRSEGLSPIDTPRAKALTQAAIAWAQGEMRGPMPVCIFEGDDTRPLHARTPEEQQIHHSAEEQLRAVGPGMLLHYNEAFTATLRNHTQQPEPYRRLAFPESPRPTLPARPRPPHVALNIEQQTAPAFRPMPTIVPAPAYVAAPAAVAPSPPITYAETAQCNTKMYLIIGGTFALVTGIGLSTYFIYRQIHNSTLGLG